MLCETSDAAFVCVFFWSAIFPVVRVLGTARRDRMYAENLVIECEVCLTFNGNNLHEYIYIYPRGTLTLASLSFRVKGEYH